MTRQIRPSGPRTPTIGVAGSMRGRWRRLAAGLAVPAMAVAACTGNTDAPDGAAAGEAAGYASDIGATPTADATTGGDATAAGRDGDIAFDVGVTGAACPDAVNPDNGCIYLGTISDLSGGPQATMGGRITRAQAAFWNRVNTDGGIGGFDVDVARFTRDNRNRPRVHRRRYAEIRDDVLALAQTFGSATTAAILDDLAADDMVAAPTTWTSQWLFTDVIVESGNTMCVEAMNAVDYTVFRGDDVETVMAIHFVDDDGEDAAAGARIAAEGNGMAFVDVATRPGSGNQANAVSEVVDRDPDLVVLATTPTETGAIVGRAAARGFDGLMITTGPGWDDALLDGPDAEAVRSLLLGARPWRAFSHGTVGHGAMREALGDVAADDTYTAGWIWSYPLRDALRAAVDAGDLTRRGLLEAVTSLEAVDYEFMLPPGSGAFGADTPAGQAVLRTVFRIPDPESRTGATREEDFFNGLTVGTYAFERPCDEAS